MVRLRTHSIYFSLFLISNHYSPLNKCTKFEPSSFFSLVSESLGNRHTHSQIQGIGGNIRNHSGQSDLNESTFTLETALIIRKEATIIKTLMPARSRENGRKCDRHQYTLD